MRILNIADGYSSNTVPTITPAVLGADGAQEYIGTGTGADVTFDVTTEPSSDGVLWVYIDGVIVEDTDYSFTHPTITFTTAPALGQRIYVAYMFNGSPIVAAGTNNVIYHTVTAGEVTAKQFTLPSTPAEPAKVLADMVGGGLLYYSVDFTISGAIFDWNGLTLDGLISASDIIRIQYFN